LQISINNLSYPLWVVCDARNKFEVLYWFPNPCFWFHRLDLSWTTRQGCEPVHLEVLHVSSFFQSSLGRERFSVISWRSAIQILRLT